MARCLISLRNLLQHGRLESAMLQLAINRVGRQGAQPAGNAMRDRRWTRREVLKTCAAVVAGVLFAKPTPAAAPPPTSVTPH